MKLKLNHNQVLLVEGKDDEHVIYALCKAHKIDENFNVRECNGFNNLLKTIPIHLKRSEIKTVGIIVDADTDVKNRWDSIKTFFLKNNYNFPTEIPNNGLIFKDNKIRIGVWIMPHNNSNGILEDFISFLIPNEDNLLSIVDETLQLIEEKQFNKYHLKDKSKARISTWLSWQKTPGSPMGTSITKKYLDVNNPQCQLFVDWISKLFEE